MICPYCGIAAKFEFENYDNHPSSDYEETGMGYALTSAACPECNGYVVVLQSGKGTMVERVEYEYFRIESVENEQIIFPLNSLHTVASEVPNNYKADFLEACAVLPLSAKASAALSRRLLQNILREHFKIKHTDLAREIDEFIQTKGAPSYLNDAIDAIRNIGNFAAHPLKSTSTGEIVEVEPGEAEWLIEVIEFLFDFAFVQPKKLEERRKKLNDKLKDLNKPPMKKK